MVCSSLPIIREIYTSQQIIPEILIFDEGDLVIKKARLLRNVPYSIYKRKAIPKLTINRNWLIACLEQMKKHSLENEPIIIVSRNGIKEIEDFFAHKNNKSNIDMLRDRGFMDKLGKILDRKYPLNDILNRKDATNREIFESLGLRFEIIANELEKKQAIIDNKKDWVYTGIVNKVHHIGVIERKNKAILYENNIVLADKEEKMYNTWAKEFVCVQHR